MPRPKRPLPRYTGRRPVRREAEALGGVLAVGDVAPHAEEPDGLADGVEQRGVEGRLVEAEQRWGSDAIGCLRC